MSQSTLGKWNPDVERVCLVFDDLQTSKRDILDKDVILPDGYTLEIGWRGDTTPAVWAELVCDTFGESAANFWTADRFVESFSSYEHQLDKDKGLFFIVNNGEVVGSAFAWLDNIPSAAKTVDKGRVHFVCVRNAHRRRGLAKKLMQSVLRYHRSQGRQSATLRTEVFRDTAIAMYEGMGFRRGSMSELLD